MSKLIVRTSQISRYRGHGAFDITRKTGGESGEPFAPSQGLLEAALAARDQVKRLRESATDLFAGTTEDRRSAAARADEIEELSWRTYVVGFIEEMRTSLRTRERSWRKMLCADGILTLICYCDNQLRCHRGLLVELLFRAARKFGVEVVWGGEIGLRGDVVSMELPWQRVLFVGPRAPESEDERRVFPKILADASELMAAMPPTTVVVAANEQVVGLSRHVLAEATRLKLLHEARPASSTGDGPLDVVGCARAIAWPAPWQPLSNDLVQRYFEQCHDDFEVRTFGPLSSDS